MNAQESLGTAIQIAGQGVAYWRSELERERGELAQPALKSSVFAATRESAEHSARRLRQYETRLRLLSQEAML
ncbi:hypothetical protein [Devosia sp.]|uniref:hypothetical protein n=1 Tax=Devosia sp. TaxID=1871048 RepID=UPI0027350760|nr:hypothetical protein [Devosia sp.]MDP2779764.1 hypothetical protein [Devosia sp.]